MKLNSHEKKNFAEVLIPAMCNRTSCAQMHELPQSHCGDNWKGTLFS